EADVTGWDLTLLTLLPPAGFNGQFNLTVNATSTESSNGDTATASVDFTVVVMNHNVVPVAVDDASATYTAAEGGSLFVAAANGVLMNDSDADNDALSVVQAATNASGSGAVSVDGVTTVTTALGGQVPL